MSKRDEDRARKKKQRRQKRLRKRATPLASYSVEEEDLDETDPQQIVANLIRSLEAHDAPAPGSWPGVSDPSLSRPDLVKLELATFTDSREPGRSKMKQMENLLQKGLLGFLPEMDHWAWEEFIWHGLPGDTWHPIDAFLEHKGDAFPPPAREQLRRWKEARIGFFEVDDVQDDTVGLREWGPIHDTLGSPFRAITLNINGVNVYRQARGRVMLTYVAPWLPAENLFCGLGYGMTLEKQSAAPAIHLLGLRHPEVVCRPLPWKVSRSAREQYLRQWRDREWHAWLGEQMRFPFLAVVMLPEGPALKEVGELTPSTPEQARQFGIYFAVPMERQEMLAAGATTIMPVDVTSVNMAALAEYRAYRDIVGPPPGTIGRGPYFRVK